MASFNNLEILCGSDPLVDEWANLDPKKYQETKAQFDLLVANGIRPNIIAKLIDVTLLTPPAPQVPTA